jgi:cyanate permease
VSPLAFGLIVDLTGSWVLPFAVSIALLLLGCAMAFTMHPERRFTEAVPGTATIGAR